MIARRRCASATRQQRREAAREAAQLRRDPWRCRSRLPIRRRLTADMPSTTARNPAAAKADAAAAKADGARAKSTTSWQRSIRTTTRFDKNGGIVNPDKGVVEPRRFHQLVRCRQAVGRAVGTENQSARNSIKQARPLLLQYIKNATGMSAQQMN